MPIKEVASYLVHIKGQKPEQVAQALVKLAGLTGESSLLDALDIRRAIEGQRDIEGKLHFPATGRILSVPFEGQQYMLKFGIDRETSWISTHPGETPGVGPIRATAELVDKLAEREKITP